ncbi:MAG: AraC family transcriptional regulator [Pseudomonadota bacterium]
MPVLIRSSSLSNYAEVARALGLDPRQQLALAGIIPAALGDPDLRIPAARVGRLLEESARQAGVDDLGLRMAERRELSNLGPLAFVLRKEPTLRRAMQSLAHYLRLQNEALHLQVEEHDDIALIRVEMFGDESQSVQAACLVVGVAYRLLAQFLGAHWHAHYISFRHGAPPSRSAYARVFGARLAFGQEFDGIVCASADFDTPIAGHDPLMAYHVGQYLDALLAQTHASPLERVQRHITALLPSGQCSADTVASAMGVDRRTVHRQLAREGLKFTAVVDRVRRELVRRYLPRSARPLSDVAPLLGFASLSAFSRWFAAAYGCSPSAWRKAA